MLTLTTACPPPILWWEPGTNLIVSTSSVQPDAVERVTTVTLENQGQDGPRMTVRETLYDTGYRSVPAHPLYHYNSSYVTDKALVRQVRLWTDITESTGRTPVNHEEAPWFNDITSVIFRQIDTQQQLHNMPAGRMLYKKDIIEKAAAIRLKGPFIWCDECGKLTPTGCFRCIGTSLHVGCKKGMTASYWIEQKAGYSVERLIENIVTTLRAHFERVTENIRVATVPASTHTPSVIGGSVTALTAASSNDTPQSKQHRAVSLAYRNVDKKGSLDWTCGEQTFAGEALRRREGIVGKWDNKGSPLHVEPHHHLLN